MNTQEFIAYLQRLASEVGSQKQLAKQLGVSPAYLGDILHGRREPGEKILKALGFQRSIYYHRSHRSAP